MKKRYVRIAVLLMGVALMLSEYTDLTIFAAESASTQIVQADDVKEEAVFVCDGKFDVAPELFENLYELDERIMETSSVMEVLPNFSASDDIGEIHNVLNGNLCPAMGEIHPFIVMVDFSDVKFDDEFHKDYVKDLFFGTDASVLPYPQESLSAWYKRSSYGKLIFSGDESDIFEIHMENTRNYYTDTDETGDSRAVSLAEEVYADILSYVADMERYDVDGNGFFDALCIIYAGDAGDWASQWWSCVTGVASDNGGAQPYAMCMEKHLSQHGLGAVTAIHEFGHLLGLPDLYDCTETHLDKQALGIHTADMMADNTGDFNALCKMLLGWIDAEKVQILNRSSDRESITLDGYTSTGACAMLYTEEHPTSLFGEFYLVQYEDLKQNGAMYDGAAQNDTFIRIYHVNAEGAFQYHNTYDGYYNLITAVDRDSHLIHGDSSNGYKALTADYNCNFFEGDELTPYTAPSSMKYPESRELSDAGVFSGLNITNIDISDDRTSATFDVFFEAAPDDQVEPLSFKPASIYDNVEVDLSSTTAESPEFYLRGNHDFFLANDAATAYIREKGKTEKEGDLSVDTVHPITVWNYPYQNHYALSAVYTGVLEKDTEYELVFPAGMFITSYGTLSDEIIVAGIHTMADDIWGDAVTFEKDGYQAVDGGNWELSDFWVSKFAVSDGANIIVPMNKSGTGLVACTINRTTGELTDEHILIEDNNEMQEQGDTFGCGYFGQTENGKYLLSAWKVGKLGAATDTCIKVFNDKFEVEKDVKLTPGYYFYISDVNVNGNKAGYFGGVIDTDTLSVYDNNGWGKTFPLNGCYLCQKSDFERQYSENDIVLLDENLEEIKYLNHLDGVTPQYVKETDNGYLLIGTRDGDIIKYLLDEDFEITNKCVLLKDASLCQIYSMDCGFVISWRRESVGYRSTVYDLSFHKQYDMENFQGTVVNQEGKEYLCSLYGTGYVYWSDGSKLRIRCSTPLDITTSDHEYGEIITKDDGSNVRICFVCGDEQVEREPDSKGDVKEEFDDIKEGQWWVEAVQFAYDHDIMAGKGTKFDPAGKLTREQFVQVLYNHSGTPAVEGAVNHFSDLKPEQWYTNAVLWANANHIASGNADGTFGIGKNITREQLALMLYNYAGLKKYDLTSTDGQIEQYSDAKKVSTWAAEALNWAVTQGIMSGKGSGNDLSAYRLDPQGTATRAECASMMMKLLQKN
ncbi:MAG: S-layer homology domain-containing protein [Lachnospiraceae bacterium]|nr:S-layer homology domain-containing protein [Lachnospiraceae bacterium]